MRIDLKGRLIFLASLLFLCFSVIFLMAFSAAFFLLILPWRLLLAFSRLPNDRKAIVIGACALCFFLSVIWRIHYLNSPTGVRYEREFIIEKGMGPAQVSHILKKDNLIRSPRFFVFLAKLYGLSKEIEPGLYRTDGRRSCLAILRGLAHKGDIGGYVTVPEGWTVRQIATLMQTKVGTDSARFVELAEDPLFCRSLGLDAKTLEGYLFPTRYRISRYASEAGVINLMLQEFETVFSEPFRHRAEYLGFSVHEVVTLASIIEKEAHVASERPIISAVFQRRLKEGIALGADPTVEYALGEHRDKLYTKDTWVDSPYNTYRNTGLPPGPIANPGRASIEAVLYPVNVDYLYFVARGDGTHIFTKTNRDHIIAKISVKREREARISKNRYVTMKAFNEDKH